MEDLSEYSTEIVEFPSYNQGKTLTKLAEISIATDPLPAFVDKSIETNKLCDAESQTEMHTGSGTNIDEKKLAQWLKKIYPLVEVELLKGPTPISEHGILDSNDDEEELIIQTYQKISLPSKDNSQGLATWLSIYTSNTPVLVLTTSASHEDWCEHVDQSVKVYAPKRVQSGSYVVFQELKIMPIKACLVSLSTNPFDKDLFAGSTISGDLYIWKFITNKNQGDVQELFCETLQHGKVVAFDWPSADKMLTCHANAWVCLWIIGKHLIKEGDFLVKSRNHTVLELTSIVSVSSTDFIVGCGDGALYHCANSNMGAHKTEIEITPMKNHKFAVTSLLRRDIAGRRLIISCDLSGEVFFHDLISSDEDGLKVILRIPLPFQNNIVCSKDGTVIFCPGIDGSLDIYRVNNARQLNIKGVLQGRGNMIKLSDNGSWIVAGLYGGDFQIFNIRNFRVRNSPKSNERNNRPASRPPKNKSKLEKRIATNLSLSDEEFVYNVNCDIADYLEKRRTNCVLLFPPVNNYRRFLIHRSCENYRENYDLFTFSVGQGPHRRTVICFKSQLLDPIKFTAASSLETRKTTQIKSWRSGGEKIESATTSSLWSSSPSSSSTSTTKTTKRDIATTTNNYSSSSSMGVEKHLDSSSSASARLNKSHSVDIYRPPALRRNLESIDNEQQQQQKQQLPLQPNDTNCISPKAVAVAGAIASYPPPETIHQNCCNGIDTATATTSCSNQSSSSTSTSTSTSNSRQVRRERRPDRAVYVPRARRSQTTPPAVSTQSQPQLQPPQQQAIPVTEINNQLTSWTATSSLSSGIVNNTTTTSTGTCKSPSGEKSSTSRRSTNKDRVSGSSGRKEKSKRHSIDEKETHKSNNNSINNHNSEEETTVSTIQRKHLQQQRTDKPSSIGSVNLNGLSNCNDNDKNALLAKDCDIINPKEFPDSTNLMNSKKSVTIAASDVKKQQEKQVLTTKMSSTSPPTPAMPEPFVAPVVISESVGNLRIEDALLTGGERSEKCDRDAEELLRASKEINRSNRRIIKQTFNSDVLEIPEKAVFDSSPTVKRITKDGSKNVVSNITSGTDEDEVEEDDWDSMYDDSGDCLDPKILQELTASVGKVKIELPKMDYTAYLTKQSILNDEEFPHVLEVSNFPTEFKNQDLLMVFSQYKESGFDIKWVDDTHALAVFSSSQVAAEVLAMGHPFVVLKPLAEATVESRLKAKKCSASLQPYRPRPETCAALARRLVTGALGVRLKTAAQERENEKRVLREAKERKLLAAKQRDEAWES